MLITPPLPPAKPFSGFLGWLIRFKIVRDSLLKDRKHQLDAMKTERQSVEYGVCEFLNENYKLLDQHWGSGKSFATQPYSIANEGLDHLQSNFALKTATEDQILVAESRMLESEFREIHGFNSAELYVRKLDYLRSVAPSQIIEFDVTKLFKFEEGWDVVVSYSNGLPTFACLGIANAPIDQFAAEKFADVGTTKPVWDRTLHEDSLDERL